MRGFKKPQGIEEEEIHKVLRGEVRCLMSAFDWTSTTEGTVYWERRCNKDTPLTNQDKQYLRFLVGIPPTLKAILEDTNENEY